MVRAAVSGAIDYSRSDPTNINWRLKQKLVLQEIQRREEVLFLSAVHQQWLAYVSHGGLTEDSFKDVKQAATRALDRLRDVVFPWTKETETEDENDTIVKENGAPGAPKNPQLNPETQKLVDQYKAWQQQREEEAKAKKEANES